MNTAVTGMFGMRVCALRPEAERIYCSGSLLLIRTHCMYLEDAQRTPISQRSPAEKARSRAIGLARPGLD